MKIDPTISLGTLIHGLVLFLAIVGGCVRIETRLTLLEDRVETLWKRSGIERPPAIIP